MEFVIQIRTKEGELVRTLYLQKGELETRTGREDFVHEVRDAMNIFKAIQDRVNGLSIPKKGNNQ